MYKCIILFFEKLTRDNWGFPWHIWLASVAAGIFFVLFNKFTTNLGYSAAMSLVCVNVGGFLHEILQRRNNKNTTKNIWQDIIGNNVGAIIQLILIYIIA